MFLTVVRSVLATGTRHGARENRRFGRCFTRQSVAIDRRPVFGVKRVVGNSVVTPIHSHGQAVFRHFLLLLLHVDFIHFGGEDFSGFFKVRVVPRVSPHSEQPVSRRLVHVQVFNEFTRLKTQIVVFIHFEVS